MAYWEAVLLGIVQGLTEFLPVSSSGHLVLGKALLGLEINDIAFEVFVHFGTLLAVLTIFKKEFIILIKGALQLVTFRFLSQRGNENPDGQKGLRLLGLLLLGTIPAAIIGYLFKDTFEAAFSHPEVVCAGLLVTGVILIISRFAQEKTDQFSWLKSLLVGIAQVLAIFPGISRSGTTITTGMLLGVERTEAARFSFLLAVPIILGATILQSVELFANMPSGKELIDILLGTVAAYGAGLFAIKWLLAVVQHGKFDRFAYYCFAVGVSGLVILYAF